MDELNINSSEGASIPEGVHISEGVTALIPEGAPAPVGVIQRQGRTRRPSPRYFGLEWSNLL